MRSLRRTSRPISSRNNFAAQARGKPGIRAGLFLCFAPEQCRRECARGRSLVSHHVGLRIGGVDSNRNDREQEHRQRSAHDSQADAPKSDRSLVPRVEMPHVESHEDRVLHRNLHPRQLLQSCAAMRPWPAPARCGAIRQAGPFARPRHFRKKSRSRDRRSDAGTSPARWPPVVAAIRAGLREIGESTRARQPPRRVRPRPEPRSPRNDIAGHDRELRHRAC